MMRLVATGRSMKRRDGFTLFALYRPLPRRRLVPPRSAIAALAARSRAGALIVRSPGCGLLRKPHLGAGAQPVDAVDHHLVARRKAVRDDRVRAVAGPRDDVAFGVVTCRPAAISFR